MTDLQTKARALPCPETEDFRLAPDAEFIEYARSPGDWIFLTEFLAFLGPKEFVRPTVLFHLRRACALAELHFQRKAQDAAMFCGGAESRCEKCRETFKEEGCPKTNNIKAADAWAEFWREVSK